MATDEIQKLVDSILPRYSEVQCNVCEAWKVSTQKNRQLKESIEKVILAHYKPKMIYDTNNA